MFYSFYFFTSAAFNRSAAGHTDFCVWEVSAALRVGGLEWVCFVWLQVTSETVGKSTN
jgi:hypothetical protein